MKRYRFILFSSMLLLALLSCRREDAHNAARLPSSPDVSCEDRGLPCAELGHYIYPGAGEMWEREFNHHYSCQQTPFYLSVDPDTLQSYLPGADSCCAGIRVYFGLQSPVDTLSEISSALCLILIPFNTNGDTISADSSVLMLTAAGNMARLPVAAARSHVDRWAGHYDLEPDFMIRVAAYNFSTTTLRRMLHVADSLQSIEGENGGMKVCFLPGFHTIGIHDSGYCWVPQALPPDTGSYVSSYPACQPNENTIYGNAAVNLIVAVRSPAGEFTRSSDFARPCPRFCGKSLLYLPVKSEWKNS